jgi:hypothetical protein
MDEMERVAWKCIECGRVNAPHLDYCDHNIGAAMQVKAMMPDCTCKHTSRGDSMFGSKYTLDSKCPIHGSASTQMPGCTCTYRPAVPEMGYVQSVMVSPLCPHHGSAGAPLMSEHDRAKEAAGRGCTCRYGGNMRWHNLKCPVHNDRRDSIMYQQTQKIPTILREKP